MFLLKYNVLTESLPVLEEWRKNQGEEFKSAAKQGKLLCEAGD